jgi:NADPH:quinone reductase-like Zn-dependent oxidoreductase
VKAIVTREYGGPDVLKLEDYPKPTAGPDEVLIKVAATSINPLDYKQRNGSVKSIAPIQFPAILGVDVSGTVAALGSGVKNFGVGDRVFAMANKTYAEFCIVKAENLARVPAGLDLTEAAALPLVLTAGYALVAGTHIEADQTLLVTGAVGNVGRSAVFSAKQKGATVIAGVRKKQFEEAGKIGADQLIALDDPQDIARLPELDAVADTIGGNVAKDLIAKVKKGGTYASVVHLPEIASEYPEAKAAFVFTRPDAKALTSLAEAVRERKLVIPIGFKLPLKDAAKGQAAVEKGVSGKVLLIVDDESKRA